MSARSATSVIYVLSVPDPPSPNNSAKPVFGPVAIREFRAPAFLREGPIVHRESPEQLGFYNYDRWAVDPRNAVTTAMARAMQARGIFQSVNMFDGRGSPEYLVTGTLDHLEEMDKGSHVSVQVGVSARLVNLRTGEVVWQDTSSTTASLDQRSVRGAVAEMSSEIGTVVEDLVTSMQNRLVTASASLRE